MNIYDQLCDSPVVDMENSGQDSIEPCKVKRISLDQWLSRQDSPPDLLKHIYELRDNQALAGFLPEDGYSALTLIQLKQSESLEVPYMPEKSILFCLRGKVSVKVSGECYECSDNAILALEEESDCQLIGKADHTVMLQIRFSRYRLAQLLNQKNHRLEKTNYTYKDIIEFSHYRLAMFKHERFCTMLMDGTLENTNKLEKYLSCLTIFSGYFQKVLYGRQATCLNKRFSNIFLSHLLEEIGHDEILKKDSRVKTVYDPLLNAVSSWFCYQMFILDDVAKAALVHLVLEEAGDFFHVHAKPYLGGQVESNYFELHAELDDGHAKMGQTLLAHQHPEVYRDIRNLINEGWDMLSAMARRVVYLVDEVE